MRKKNPVFVCWVKKKLRFDQISIFKPNTEKNIIYINFFSTTYPYRLFSDQNLVNDFKLKTN